MTERPDFLDELGRQLQRGHRRVAEQRQRRRHRLAAATVVVALVPVVAGTWRLLDTGSSDQIDATASGPDEDAPPTAGPTSEDEEGPTAGPAGEEGATGSDDPRSDDDPPAGRPTVALEPRAVGDGSTMTRVVADDGSVFALRLPAAFGHDIDQITAEGPEVVAALAGEAFGARIEIGFCRYEPLTVNALGLPMASVRDRKPPPDLSFCRPDEFVRLIIEPVPDIEFSADHIDLIPVSFGTDYVGWVKANVEPNGQCCFLDRGPMHHGDTMVVADGHGSTQVTGLDAETLVPVWTTDLATLLLGDGRDRVGDSSHLLAVTDAGTVLTTTGFGSIVALDPDSGELRWVADLGQETPAGLSIVDETSAVVTSSITTEGDLTAPTVRMIDLDSGAEVWAAEVNQGTELQWSRPVLIGGLVVVADVPSYRNDPDSAPTASVTAFEVSTGDRAWISPLDSATDAFASFETILTDPDRDLLLVTDVSGSLYRLDPTTGARIWTSTPGLGPMVGLSPDTVTVRVGGTDIDLSLETGEVAG